MKGDAFAYGFAAAAHAQPGTALSATESTATIFAAGSIDNTKIAHNDSQVTLEVIADRLGLKLSSNGATVHLLSPKKYSNALLRAFSRHSLSQVSSLFLGIGRRSLLNEDYFQMTGKRL